ncbi:transposase [Helicobacter cinaedi]|uniref:RNA-guided endonuclease InsQ/TnpB family protein n=1 Tax=Helicobacter cinaedi TaxID=213 RepID=UPI001F32C54B|nr:transposase [Helicobacter cinaedi]BDB63998.1 transposase [Helicobacter cinaedi]BDB64004.1 transposase [Helicobacter cinaedi]BDB64193.1 transposase [Helicobacter cinaedi]
MKITKGFKYRIYPSIEQTKALDHQCFIYNQAFNICLNLWLKEMESNKDLDKENKKYLKAVDYDRLVKVALKERNLPFKSVVTQQARVNFLLSTKRAFSKEAVAERKRAIEQAQTPKQKAKAANLGMPNFKNSKLAKTSFNWNNQGFQILDSNNPKFKIFRLMSMPLKMRHHRAFPQCSKVNQITISKNNNKYYVSFSITYKQEIKQVDLQNLTSNKCVGIDLNVNDVALSNGELIKTLSKKINAKKYDKAFKRLQRKQSRRILKSKEAKTKLGGSFKKTQKRLNKIYERSSNIKKDSYHKITAKLVKEFDLIAVEALKNKNMTKRAKLKNVKQKSGLNRSILNASFYQFAQILEYKASHNGKFFVRVNPQYTSKTCNVCRKIHNDLTLKDRVLECECGNIIHRDINASLNILERGLKSFGLGISLEDYKLKAFRVS